MSQVAAQAEVSSEIKSIVITGRRWFEKTYGNTYFSVVALIDGKEVVSIPFEYGYGEMYKQRAVEEMHKKGVLPGMIEYNYGLEAIWTYCERKGINLHYSATDVRRKKDL